MDGGRRPRERLLFAELWPAVIDDGAIVAASLLANGAGKPALADARRTDQGQIVVGVDPLALGELLEQGAVEATGRRGNLRPRRSPAGGVLRGRAQPLVAPPRCLFVEQQSEPVVAIEFFRLIGLGEFDEGPGHSVKAKGVELVERWMFEQSCFS